MRGRESLGTDSLVFDRFRTLASARAAFCANFFCTAFALHKIAFDTKYFALQRDKNFAAVFAAKYHTRKQPLCHRMFCNARDLHSRARVLRIRSVVAMINHVVARAFHVKRRAHIHCVKWSQCFFHCSVVNGVQCVSIPDRTDATPAIT